MSFIKGGDARDPEAPGVAIIHWYPVSRDRISRDVFKTLISKKVVSDFLFHSVNHRLGMEIYWQRDWIASILTTALYSCKAK